MKTNQEKSRERKAIEIQNYILGLKNLDELRIHISGTDGFIYKGMIYTQKGVLLFDTGGRTEHLTKKTAADKIKTWARTQPVGRWITADELLDNWQKFKPWSERRFELALLEKHRETTQHKKTSLTKFVLVITDKNGQKTWTEHHSVCEAEEEAELERSDGSIVYGPVEVDFFDQYPAFKLGGHTDPLAERFGEIFQHGAIDDVVGSVGGFEATLDNLKALRNWLNGAIEHCEETNTPHLEKS